MEMRDILKEVITDKEWLVKFKNQWRSKLIANAVDLKSSRKTKEGNPRYAEVLPNGQVIQIDEIIKQKESGIEEALGFLEVVDELMKAEKEGKLEEYWKEYKPFLPKLNIIKPEEKPLSLDRK